MTEQTVARYCFVDDFFPSAGRMMLRGEGCRGKCVSRRRYFYGFRVQLIATEQGHGRGQLPLRRRRLHLL